MEKGQHSNIRHIILVLSGKGGVGKSTFASQLAIGLKRAGKKVGLLDVDLCGPSIPKLFGIEDQDVHQCSDGWVPVYVDAEQQLGIMSIGFLLKNDTDAVVWRGPKKNSMIGQFLRDVYWQQLDYLVIDTPPGTSDEHMAVVENIRRYNPDGAVLVTTPQAVAVGDVRREITFCKKTSIPILGIVENMSGFICPNCNECSSPFSTGGGESLAQLNNIRFLGRVPFDSRVSQAASVKEVGFTQSFSDSPAAQAVLSIVQCLLERDTVDAVMKDPV